VGWSDASAAPGGNHRLAASKGRLSSANPEFWHNLPGEKQTTRSGWFRILADAGILIGEVWVPGLQRVIHGEQALAANFCSISNRNHKKRGDVSMQSELFQEAIMKAQAYSQAYVRNLVAAEKAVSAGQFNAAKVLRAAAHSQRVMAMNAIRLAGKPDTGKIFEVIIQELDTGTAEHDTSLGPPGSLEEIQASHKQLKVVEKQLKEILSRALASLNGSSDVLESDVNQVIWGCYSCGFLIEGELPDVCPTCGALNIEFEWFGPFYSSTPEHLGQRTPNQIISTLEKIPAQVEELIGGVDEALLSRRPSQEEWCVKEIVGHIIEVERLFLNRVRTIINSQGIPELPSAAPPWKLHEDKQYEHWKGSELISQLNETRQVTLAFLYNLKGEDWTRQGSNQGSPVSLLDLGTWLANHDAGHVAQIKRYIPTRA
jgi:rubrerythrin